MGHQARVGDLGDLDRDRSDFASRNRKTPRDLSLRDIAKCRDSSLRDPFTPEGVASEGIVHKLAILAILTEVDRKSPVRTGKLPIFSHFCRTRIRCPQLVRATAFSLPPAIGFSQVNVV